jgi:hypothetical protein
MILSNIKNKIHKNKKDKTAICSGGENKFKRRFTVIDVYYGKITFNNGYN